ncbi:uncharacterized protein LOC133825663 [Humulus lupulus]|uniref:uncharacterized protein LOC133825663 n=1 Tax=Humulus lupulus TaxID=3486 RepID=UPI002B417FD7|nr:uncharacterized protein LOC133825663 [Humulus lupulus]
MLACKLISEGQTLDLRRTWANFPIACKLAPIPEGGAAADDGEEQEEDEVPLVRKRRAAEATRNPDADRALSGASAGPSGQGEEMAQRGEPDIHLMFQEGRSSSGPLVKKIWLSSKKTPPPAATAVLAQHHSIARARAKNDELKAELQTAQATLTATQAALVATQQGEQSANAALTAAQAGKQAAKAALAAAQEGKQVAKAALVAAQEGE